VTATSGSGIRTMISGSGCSIVTVGCGMVMRTVGRALAHDDLGLGLTDLDLRLRLGHRHLGRGLTDGHLGIGLTNHDAALEHLGGAARFSDLKRLARRRQPRGARRRVTARDDAARLVEPALFDDALIVLYERLKILALRSGGGRGARPGFLRHGYGSHGRAAKQRRHHDLGDGG
jgi:hypothetical protein